MKEIHYQSNYLIVKKWDNNDHNWIFNDMDELNMELDKFSKRIGFLDSNQNDYEDRLVHAFALVVGFELEYDSTYTYHEDTIVFSFDYHRFMMMDDLDDRF